MSSMTIVWISARSYYLLIEGQHLKLRLSRCWPDQLYWTSVHNVKTWRCKKKFKLGKFSKLILMVHKCVLLSRYANTKNGLKFKLRFQESMICPLLAFVPKISMWGVLSNVHKKDAFRFHLSNIVRCGIERLSNNKKVPGFLMCLPQLRCKWICAFHFNSPMNIRRFSIFISC